jgi:hypothetical protein
MRNTPLCTYVMLSILVFQKLTDKLYSPGKGIISWKLLSGSNIMRILPQKHQPMFWKKKQILCELSRNLTRNFPCFQKGQKIGKNSSHIIHCTLTVIHAK